MTQLAKNIDVSKLRYSEVKSLSSGAKTVYVNYGTNKLTIQTPVLYAPPYGITEPYAAKEAAKNGSILADKDKKYDLNVSFRGIDENPKVKIFHDKMKEIESKIIDDAFANRLAWFKDDFDGNKAFMAKLFTPIIKVDKDKETGKLVGKYPPSFKAKLPYDYKTGLFTFDAYDMENNDIEFQSIMNNLKNAKVQLIIQLSGIWFAGGKYGCSWKVVSGKFQLSENNKVMFIDDSDTENIGNLIDEEEDDISVDGDVLKTLKIDDKTKKAPVESEDEDNDDDDDEEDEPKQVEEPPKPAPKPVKKTGKK